MYIKATEAATPVNGPAVQDHLWLWGTNCGDAKCRRWSPGPSVAAVHGRRDHPWLPHLVRGIDCRGTIGSVTVYVRTYLQFHRMIKRRSLFTGNRRIGVQIAR